MAEPSAVIGHKAKGASDTFSSRVATIATCIGIVRTAGGKKGSKEIEIHVNYS